MTGTIGLLGALFPAQWIGLFSTQPEVVAAGSTYLRIVGPTYGFFGLGLTLYFSSQGAGRLLWPVTSGFARLTIAAAGGWVVVVAFGGGLAALFAAMAVAMIVFGSTLAIDGEGGSWNKSEGASTAPSDASP